MPGIHPNFIQEGPSLTNTYLADDLLRHYLEWRLPAGVLTSVDSDLRRFGERCAGEIQTMGEEAEARPPRHVPYDPWGRRVDRIEVAEGWNGLHRVSAEEGLIALGYERKSGAHSRVHQFAKLYLFHPSSAFYTCPLAMTDGAARVLEIEGPEELKVGAFKNLTTRDPLKFWTSGQWMTEKTGGSDVSGTSTVARFDREEGGLRWYKLFGDKWFTSAVTANMALTLAKVEGATDPREGLSLFYVELRDSRGDLRNIRVHRLKDKLGTKALPTAELTLDGMPAVLLGEIGEGVKRIATLLNITRLYNSITAIGTVARGLQLAKDYARKREAFGRKLSELPLHVQTLAEMQTEFEATFHLTFHLTELLGREETGAGGLRESALVRLLTPIVKLWSAKQALDLTNDVLESFGGAGYIEDTGIPRLLRDARVFSLWEGTTNVLSLDVLRAIGKGDALEHFYADVDERLASVSTLPQEAGAIRKAVGDLRAYFRDTVAKGSTETQQGGARSFAIGLARVYAAALLLEFAQWCRDTKKRPASEEVARRFCRTRLLDLRSIEALDSARASQVVFGS